MGQSFPRTDAPCYIWVFLGFLEIVPEEQRTVGSVMLQFIQTDMYRYMNNKTVAYLLLRETPGIKSIGRLSPSG